MSRIRKMYETRFRALLQGLNARRLDRGVQWMVTRAQRSGGTDGVSLTQALAGVCEGLKQRVARFRSRLHPYESG